MLHLLKTKILAFLGVILCLPSLTDKTPSFQFADSFYVTRNMFCSMIETNYSSHFETYCSICKTIYQDSVFSNETYEQSSIEMASKSRLLIHTYFNDENVNDEDIEGFQINFCFGASSKVYVCDSREFYVRVYVDKNDLFYNLARGMFESYLRNL